MEFALQVYTPESPGRLASGKFLRLFFEKLGKPFAASICCVLSAFTKTCFATRSLTELDDPFKRNVNSPGLHPWQLEAAPFLHQKGKEPHGADSPEVRAWQHSQVWTRPLRTCGLR